MDADAPGDDPDDEDLDDPRRGRRRAAGERPEHGHPRRQPRHVDRQRLRSRRATAIASPCTTRVRRRASSRARETHIRTPLPSTARSSSPPRTATARRPQVQFPAFHSGEPILGGPFLTRRDRRRRGQRVAVRERVCAGAATGERREHAVRLRGERRALPRPGLHLQRDTPAEQLPARLVPVPVQARLLPAVRGRDGAAAQAGRRAGARGDRLHRRAPTTPRSTSGRSATSTRTPGSRPGSRTTAGSASIPRPAADPALGGRVPIAPTTDVGAAAPLPHGVNLPSHVTASGRESRRRQIGRGLARCC